LKKKKTKGRKKKIRKGGKREERKYIIGTEISGILTTIGITRAPSLGEKGTVGRNIDH
jgi:hypothetical protein